MLYVLSRGRRIVAFLLVVGAFAGVFEFRRWRAMETVNHILLKYPRKARYNLVAFRFWRMVEMVFFTRQVLGL